MSNLERIKQLFDELGIRYDQMYNANRQFIGLYYGEGKAEQLMLFNSDGSLRTRS